jgi:hypothetical protein
MIIGEDSRSRRSLGSISIAISAPMCEAARRTSFQGDPGFDPDVGNRIARYIDEISGFILGGALEVAREQLTRVASREAAPPASPLLSARSVAARGTDVFQTRRARSIFTCRFWTLNGRQLS